MRDRDELMIYQSTCWGDEDDDEGGELESTTTHVLYFHFIATKDERFT